MKDRNVQHASRFRLTKVPGTDDVYDLIPAPGEVYEEGTLINKSALLKDATAALFGLDENAVPDDALAVLSRFNSGLGNEYVWAKTTMVETAQIGGSVFRNTNVMISKQSIADGATPSTTENIEYSNSVSVVNGVLVLDNPSVVPVSYADYTSVNVLVGKYVKFGANVDSYAGQILYVESGSAWRNKSNSLWWVGLSGCTAYEVRVTTNFITAGYVNSPDPNAYPPAEPDGYTYKSFGQLGNKVKIETGSYVGTGTYGSSNPNSLTFEFVPKLVIVYPKSLNGADKIMEQSDWVIFTQFAILRSESSSNGFGAVCNAPLTCGNALTWWTESNDSGAAYYQGNDLGSVYQYIAIG